MNTHIVTGREAVLYYGKTIFPDFNLNNPARAEMYERVFTLLQASQLPKEERPARTKWKDRPERGILMPGNMGVGKTILFKTMNLVFRKQPASYKYAHARISIQSHLKEFGEVSAMKEFGYNLKKNLLIDDVGVEDKGVYDYATLVNLITNILSEREELYRNEGFKYHLISNLKTDSLEERYGDRVFDRLVGSTNVISWMGTSLRSNPETP